MTDLTGKFGGLETVLATQHTETLDAINAITSLLGGAPPTPSATLDNVVTALTQTNVILAGIRSDQSSQAAALLSVVTGISNNIDLMIENTSINTQRLLAAILANDPCKTCDATHILPPPLDVTPQDVNNVHCQRMQALLYALSRFSVKIDVISSFGTGFSLTVIQDAYTEVLTELSNPTGLALPSFVEFTSLVASIVAYIVSSVFESNSIPFSLESIHDELLAGLYASTNASEGLAEYATIINASSLSTAMKSVLVRIGYTSLFNFYFDPANTIDLTGYDGTICAPPVDTGCVTLNSYHVDAYGGSHVLAVDQATYVGKYYKLHMVTGYVQVYYDPGLGFTNEADGYTGQFTQAGHTDALSGSPNPSYQFWGIGGTDLPFTVEICPTAFEV